MTTHTKGQRGIGYVRVSKVGDRGDDMLSPEIQETAIRDFARRNGITVTSIVTDLDQSGRTFAKRQVGDIISAIERREADVVIVWKWSRWARNTAEGLSFLAKVMQAGGNVRAATEDFDTSTGVGEFSRDMMLALAALQSNQIGEGWKETHANRRARGLPHTMTARFGYVRRDGAYVVDETKRELLADAYQQLASGALSMRQLSQDWNELGITTAAGNTWTLASVARMLDTGFAAGLIRERSSQGNGNHTTLADFDLWREGAHDPIISISVWEAYKARRAETAARPRRLVNLTHALSGLLVCATCERTLNSHYIGTKTAQRHGWRCSEAMVKRTHKGASMENHRVEAAVLAWIQERATGESDVTAEARKLDAARRRAQANVRGLEKRRDDLVATRKRIARQVAAARITDEDADEMLAELADDMTKVEAALRATADIADAPKPEPIVFRGIADAWENATPASKAQLIRSVIGRIVIQPGRFTDPRDKVQIQPRWAV